MGMLDSVVQRLPTNARTRTAWVVGAALVGAAVSIVQYFDDAELAVRQTKDSLVAQQFRPREAKVEHYFTQSYQTIRTVGMLPSVRQIEGGNRATDDDDVVEQGRFSPDAHKSVEQLYTNLASNVPVSEIYAVLTGFDRDAGEVPFFMYDKAVFGLGGAEEEAGPPVPDDFPEEYEEEEYVHYPKQIAYFAQAFPRLRFANIEEVPALSSPALRTCDNTQYRSEAEHDVHDADGLLYSVPFYNLDGDLRGIISAVLRVNILEAAVVGVPHLILTDDDKASAKAEKFEMPEHVASFVLYNEAQDVWIADRRADGLIADLRGVDLKHTEDWHSTELNIHDSDPWILAYRYDADAITDAGAGPLRALLIKLGAFSLMILIGGAWIRSIERKREEVRHLSETVRSMMVGGIDLTRRVDVERTDEVGDLMRVINTLFDKVESAIVQVQSTANVIGTSSNAAHGASAGLTQTTGNLKGKSGPMAIATEELYMGIDEMSQMVGEASERVNAVGQSTTEMSTELAGVAKRAEQVSTDVNLVSNAVARIGQGFTQIAENTQEASSVATDARNSSIKAQETLALLTLAVGEISDVVTIINDIARRTNLLGINAAIESARAGESGRGFAVVANEVKDLANKTKERTAEVSRKIGLVVRRAEDARDAISGISSVIDQINEISDRTVTTVEEEYLTTTQIVETVADTAARTQRIATAVEGCSNRAATMVEHMQELRSFAVRQSETAKRATKKTEELAEDVSALSAVADDTSEAADQVASLVHDLSGAASQLKTVLGNFHLASADAE